MRVLTAIALIVAFMAAPAAARGRHADARLTVTASVTANCVMRAIGTLNFGTYGSANVRGKALKAADKVLSIACTKGSPGVRIALSDGHHFTNGKRHMHDKDKDRIAYQIYTNRSHKTVWNAVNTVSYAPTSDAPTEIKMFGKIPGGQRPPSGDYHDTLMATVDF